MPPRPRSHTSFPQRLGKGMTVLAWLLALGFLTLYFNYRLDEQYNPNQRVQSQITAGGALQVMLERNRMGHYVATGYINGQAVEFLLDTGATQVSIPATVAEQLKLTPGAPLSMYTANGTITTYATVLDQVELGGIALQGIRANINPQMQGDGVLLGMSFLQYLEFTQRGGTLTLKEYSP